MKGRCKPKSWATFNFYVYEWPPSLPPIHCRYFISTCVKLPFRTITLLESCHHFSEFHYEDRNTIYGRKHSPNAHYISYGFNNKHCRRLESSINKTTTPSYLRKIVDTVVLHLTPRLALLCFGPSRFYTTRIAKYKKGTVNCGLRSSE